MKHYSNKLLPAALLGLALLSYACGSIEDEAADLATSGDLTVSCSYEFDTLTSCTETRDISRVFADQIIKNCDEVTETAGAGRVSTCPNRDQSFGVCKSVVEGDQIVFTYKSGEGLTAEQAESSCQEADDVWTPKS